MCQYTRFIVLSRLSPGPFLGALWLPKVFSSVQGKTQCRGPPPVVWSGWTAVPQAGWTIDSKRFRASERFRLGGHPKLHVPARDGAAWVSRQNL